MAADIASTGTADRMIKVWDPLVRLFHWSLVAAFFTAYLTGDAWERVHENAGYVIMGLVAFRIVWGFVGSEHARFANFIRSPRETLAFIGDTVRLRARRYIGHNPAGAVMILALLAMLTATTATGYMMTTDTFWGMEWVEEVHEAAANLTLALVALHVLGVIVASCEHGENLVRAMITGSKRAE